MENIGVQEWNVNNSVKLAGNNYSIVYTGVKETKAKMKVNRNLMKKNMFNKKRRFI